MWAPRSSSRSVTTSSILRRSSWRPGNRSRGGRVPAIRLSAKGIKRAETFGRIVDRHADVVVIGAGPGGYPAAIRAAQLGKRVLLVERDRLGGECLNYGCIPSKALIHPGNLVRAIERAGERGVETGPVKVDLARLQQWKTSVVQRLVTGIGQLCKGNGVDVLSGHASFMGPNDLEVRKAD